MTIPKEAQQLQQKLNEIARLLDESRDLAESPDLHSEAVIEALDGADDQIRTASEQLANVVGGL